MTESWFLERIGTVQSPKHSIDRTTLQVYTMWPQSVTKQVITI